MFISKKVPDSFFVTTNSPCKLSVISAKVLFKDYIYPLNDFFLYTIQLLLHESKIA